MPGAVRNGCWGEKAEAERKMAEIPHDPLSLQGGLYALMQLKEIWEPVGDLFGTDRRSAAGKWMEREHNE